MSTKHTPGPWHIADGSKLMVHAGDVWVASTMGVRGDTGEANARLIAAAPDLLEALYPFVAQNTSEEFITITVKSAHVTRARAAIAKATGEAA